jgi:predicted metal-dependent phosphoesterase TrpH
MDEVEHEAKGQVIGRPHIAAVLLRKGYVSSIKQAFDKYLAQGAPAYFDKERLSPKRALELIHQSGGLAVLAHPIQLRTTNDAELSRVIKDLVDLAWRVWKPFTPITTTRHRQIHATSPTSITAQDRRQRLPRLQQERHRPRLRPRPPHPRECSTTSLKLSLPPPLKPRDP